MNVLNMEREMIMYWHLLNDLHTASVCSWDFSFLAVSIFHINKGISVTTQSSECLSWGMLTHLETQVLGKYSVFFSVMVRFPQY